MNIPEISCLMMLENSINCQMEMDFYEASEVLRLMKIYNGMKSNAEMMQMLTDIDLMLPKRDTRRDYKLKLGNEGSFVMYFERHVIVKPMELFREWRTGYTEIHKRAIEAGADEVSLNVKNRKWGEEIEYTEPKIYTRTKEMIIDSTNEWMKEQDRTGSQPEMITETLRIWWD